MRWLLALLGAWALSPGIAMAQSAGGYRTLSVESWVEEWDARSQSWVRVTQPETRVEIREVAASVQRKSAAHSASSVPLAQSSVQAWEYAKPLSASYRPRAIAQYGPFLVLDARRAAMVGSTTRASPAHFDAMLRDFPDLRILEMIEVPGTTNDIANFAVGRKIRAAGLGTHVPSGGSVRSGAVELFLAGQTRSIAPGAQFAVHSWRDNFGREPDDFAPDDPANRLYLDYYEEMGMSQARSRAFYGMTNSVPHAQALWLQADQMRRWIEPESVFVPAFVDATPLPNPLEVLDIKRERGPFWTAYSGPKIDYAPVFGVGLADLRPIARHAFLDSQSAFP